MKKKNFLLKTLLYVLQGALVGVGAILPGVSGGVLCVSFGIYEPMMELFTHPWKTFKEQYKMFIPVGIGWVLGFILLAKALELFFAAYPTIALMLFFGLIMGTLPELFKTSEKSSEKASWTPFILSLSFAFLLFQILESGNTTTIEANIWSYLLCGIIWGLSLIIPGLSSSTLLIYVGLYEPMTAGIGNLDFSVLLPVMGGILVTALALARFVSMLYKKHYALISRIILGFVVASSLKILPTEFEGPIVLLISILCFGAGFALARGMDLAKNKHHLD